MKANKQFPQIKNYKYQHICKSKYFLLGLFRGVFRGGLPFRFDRSSAQSLYFFEGLVH